MNTMNILLFCLGGFFTGLMLNRITEKRTGGHPPVLFLPFLCLSCFILCLHRPFTDSLVCCMLILAGAVDHYSGEIPDRCSLVLFLCSLLHGFSAEGALSMSWLVFPAVAGWLGWGDVKLMISAGGYLGMPAVWCALVLGFWAAAAAEIPKKNRRKQIPMAPWLAAGCLISLFCGDFLVHLIIWHRIPF